MHPKTKEILLDPNIIGNLWNDENFMSTQLMHEGTHAVKDSPANSLSEEREAYMNQDKMYMLNVELLGGDAEDEINVGNHTRIVDKTLDKWILRMYPGIDPK